MQSKLISIFGILTLAAWPDAALAGKFNYGFMSTKSDMINLQIPRPPDAYPQVKTLQVEMAEMEERFRDVKRLKLQIEQAIAQDFQLTATNADAKVRITVVNFEPPQVERLNTTEKRSVSINNNKSEFRDVQVTYWLGRGRISLRVEMTDKAGIPLDSFDPEFSFNVKREIAVNGSAVNVGTHDMSWKDMMSLKQLRKGDQQQGTEWVPNTEDDISSVLYLRCGQLVRRRYVRTVEDVQFKLAADDELREGNKLALAPTPDWEGAIKVWDSTKMKNPKSEGDRQYNLAAGHEALAYKAYNATLNPNDALPFFEKAMAIYDKAKILDPDEKYIVGAAERLKLAKDNVARAVDQRKAWEAQRERMRDDYLAKREGQKQITEERPDTPDEGRFRLIARTQMDTAGGMGLPQLESLAKSMNLEEVSVKRVLYHEQERQKRLKQYEDLLKPLVGDGQLSKAERGALEATLAALKISGEEAKVIEARHKFTEEGVAPPAAPQPAPPVAPTLAPVAAPVPKPRVPAPPKAPQPKPVAAPKPAAKP